MLSNNRKNRRAEIKKVKHNYYTKKYSSRRARETARRLLSPHNWRKEMEAENKKDNKKMIRRT